MDDTTPPPVDEALKRNILSLSTLLAKMPANVIDRPFGGALAVMEVMRVVRAVHSLDAHLGVADQRQGVSLTHIEPLPDGLGFTINDTPLHLEWVIFHRSGLIAFDHILCCVTHDGIAETLLIAADHSPLVDDNGARLLRRHSDGMVANREGAAEFFKELEGIADMIRSGKGAMPFPWGQEEATDE